MPLDGSEEYEELICLCRLAYSHCMGKINYHGIHYKYSAFRLLKGSFREMELKREKFVPWKSYVIHSENDNLKYEVRELFLDIVEELKGIKIGTKKGKVNPFVTILDALKTVQERK